MPGSMTEVPYVPDIDMVPVVFDKGGFGRVRYGGSLSTPAP